MPHVTNLTTEDSAATFPTQEPAVTILPDNTAGIPDAASAPIFFPIVPCLKRLILYHEAGHCIAALALGIEVYRATITWGDEIEGSLSHQTALGYEDGVITAAGPVAERIWRGRGATWGASALDDLAHLRRLAKDLRVPLPAFRKAVWQSAEALLRRYWNALVSIAEALNDNDELNGVEIQRLWDSAEGEP
jgi:hypothetical protein